MNKLRLLITTDCPRNCAKCCNKQYDINSIPIATHFNYDEILITGGEPLNDDWIDYTKGVVDSLYYLHFNSNRKVYVYTADAYGMCTFFYMVDGFTLTLHDSSDIEGFEYLYNSIINEEMIRQFIQLKGYPPSLRLNVFKGVKIPEHYNLKHWIIKDNLEWLDSCPIPEGEDFRRLNTFK